MARNEEKQLARLNRFYLQKDKEAQLKKNPPRPRLETLNTSAEIQKWLPSIKKDLNFYVKQSEVTCYPQSKIDEFSRKINHLKWEYRSFVHKFRELNPGLEITPWTDRPYTGQKRKAEAANTDEIKEKQDDAEDHKISCLETSISEPAHISSHNNCDLSQNDKHSESVNTYNSNITADNNSLITADTIDVITFTPLNTPLLEQDTCYNVMYGYSKPAPLILNVNEQLEDLPLEFSNSNKTITHGNYEKAKNRDELFNNFGTDRPFSDKNDEDDPFSGKTDVSLNNVGIGCTNLVLQKRHSDGQDKLKRNIQSNPVLVNQNIGDQDQHLQVASCKSRTCLDHPKNTNQIISCESLMCTSSNTCQLKPGLLTDAVSLLVNQGKGEQENPLQFADSRSRTCTNQSQDNTNPLHSCCDGSIVCSISNTCQLKYGLITDAVSEITDQHPFKTDMDHKCRPSLLTCTHIKIDETCHSPNTELNKNCLKVSSSLVVPYSDSESEMDP